jgi:hypothetical protein
MVDKSDTSQDVTGSTKKATVRKLLGDKALPTGDFVGTTDTQTLTDKTLSTGSVIDANVNVIEVLKKAYPIGSVYINASNATNPASLLGFGTWSAFGAGKVMVGLDAGDTSFDTLGETGGEKTHTLTVAEMPSHNHSVSGTYTDNPYYVKYQNDTTYYGYYDDTNGGAGKYLSVANSVASQGGGGAHNNLQPYIVVYFWKRTA